MAVVPVHRGTQAARRAQVRGESALKPTVIEFVSFTGIGLPDGGKLIRNGNALLHATAVLVPVFGLDDREALEAVVACRSLHSRWYAETGQPNRFLERNRSAMAVQGHERKPQQKKIPLAKPPGGFNHSIEASLRASQTLAF